MIFGGMTADAGVYLAHVPLLPRPRKRGNAPGVGDPSRPRKRGSAPLLSEMVVACWAQRLPFSFR
jgi:hypothetical protein